MSIPIDNWVGINFDAQINYTEIPSSIIMRFDLYEDGWRVIEHLKSWEKLSVKILRTNNGHDIALCDNGSIIGRLKTADNYEANKELGNFLAIHPPNAKLMLVHLSDEETNQRPNHLILDGYEYIEKSL